jgi:hypothetical protein
MLRESIHYTRQLFEEIGAMIGGIIIMQCRDSRNIVKSIQWHPFSNRIIQTIPPLPSLPPAASISAAAAAAVEVGN